MVSGKNGKKLEHSLKDPTFNDKETLGGKMRELTLKNKYKKL